MMIILKNIINNYQILQDIYLIQVLENTLVDNVFKIMEEIIQMELGME